MAYTKLHTPWKNADTATGGGDTSTPFNAAALDYIEEGIEEAHDLVGALTTRVTAEEAQPDVPTVVNGKWLKGVGGAMVWSDIVIADIATLQANLDSRQALSQKGIANGYASLDASALVPDAQIPAAIARDAEVTSAISTHEADTTAVHGIANTALLETATGAQAKVDTHVNDTVDAHDASAISFAPAGTIAATDVQAALVEVAAEAGGGGGGAPVGAGYLVTAADAGLSAEVVVGTAPGGELGGTWASPTVDASHSGSTHAAVQAAAEATAAGALSTHVAAADPHTGYQRESEKAAANGYASLDGSTLVPLAQIPTITAAKVAADVATQAELDAHTGDAVDAHVASAIGFTPGGTVAATTVQAAIAEVATEYNAADVLLSGSKANLADAVMDGDLAGGVLGGSYPNPSFAADMATQAELDASAALKVDKDSVVAAATRIVASKLAGGDAQPAFRVLGDGDLEWGPGGSTAPDTKLYRGGASMLFTEDELWALRAAGEVALGVSALADAQARFRALGSGTLEFGDGAAVPDTNLYRGAANTLKTDDWLYVVGQILVGAADVNLYRQAANHLKSDDQFDPASLNLPTKAGLPADGDDVGTVADGMIRLDTSSNTLYVRSNGGWRPLGCPATHFDMQSGNANLTLVANQACLIPLPGIETTFTFTRIGYRVGTQLGNLDWGIYYSDNETTFTRQGSTGSYACPAAGLTTKTIAAVTITPYPGRRWYMALAGDAAAVLVGTSSIMPGTWLKATSFPLPSSLSTMTEGVAFPYTRLMI